MSLKQDRKSRSSIGRFIAALLRPFMSEPPPPQLPRLLFHSPDARYTENVVDWNSHMSQYLDDDDDTNYYAKCFLRHIEYCKCSQGVEHEFLLFYFGHWTSRYSAVGVVCADRTVSIHSDNSSSSGQPSGLVSPSSTDNIAHDTVTIIGSPHDATRYLTKTYGSFKTLCTLKFTPSSPPSALQVSVVLSLVNDHSRNYHIYERQCYWFADTVWKSLKRLFPENAELCVRHNVRCRCGPFHLGPSEESVDAVCEGYKMAWNNTLEQMREARRRRAVQQERAEQREREMQAQVLQAEQREREIQAQVLQAEQREREMQAQVLQAEQREREMQAQVLQAEQREREIQAQAEQRQREMQAQVLQAEQREREMQAQVLQAQQREREMQAQFEEKTRAMQAEIERLRAEQAGP